MCDDLVSGIEEALNPERLETLYMKYVSDLKSRRKLGCKEIHIATRWSVHDPIGHLQSLIDDDSRARFIAVDCFDENGQSVFDFKFKKGFSTKYFREMEQTMDDITFRCMYRSDPIEREGLLYHKDDIKTYLGGLPREDSDKIKEPDAILAICDTKDTGTDYNCLLVVYQYGQNFYLEDLVYDNGSPYVLDELNANCLVKNNVQMAQFESNKEGSRTGNEVQRLIKEKGGRCVITKKYTTTNKETKIIVNSDWVKQHILFKDPVEYEPKSMYGQFMRAVFSYVTLGKNKHDDSVDALAMLALFVQSLEGSIAEVYSRKELGI
jgi:predicted phage terminase large subunit-like protein